MYNDSEKELFVSSAVNREHVADIVVVLVVAVFATDADTSMLIQGCCLRGTRHESCG